MSQKAKEVQKPECKSRSVKAGVQKAKGVQKKKGVKKLECKKQKRAVSERCEKKESKHKA